YWPNLLFLSHDFRPFHDFRVWLEQELHARQRLGNGARERVPTIWGGYSYSCCAQLLTGESTGDFCVLDHLQKIRPASQQRVVYIIGQHARKGIDIRLTK